MTPILTVPWKKWQLDPYAAEYQQDGVARWWLIVTQDGENEVLRPSNDEALVDQLVLMHNTVLQYAPPDDNLPIPPQDLVAFTANVNTLLAAHSAEGHGACDWLHRRSLLRSYRVRTASV